MMMKITFLISYKIIMTIFPGIMQDNDDNICLILYKIMMTITLSDTVMMMSGLFE